LAARIFLMKGLVMKITLRSLQTLYTQGEKMVMLTAYDASFAQLAATAGVEMLLVGDSLGMVIQGQGSTLPVTLDDMIYHTQAVARGAGDALVLADLPFGAYQLSKEQAFESAVRLIQAGAQMVKLEGGLLMAESIAFLTERGIPVCGHIGLMPQSVNSYGGYVVQGKTQDDVERLVQEAQALAVAGASLIVLECVPSSTAKAVAAAVNVPIIGIGAGADVAGQVLVVYDALGISQGRLPKFVRNFMNETGVTSLSDGVKAYVQAVKQGTFPRAEESYS
jgi:3-methyl-2-oxobutanoate hydroxymethyltransferase